MTQYLYTTTDGSPFGLAIPATRKRSKPPKATAEPKAPAKFTVQRDGATIARHLVDDETVAAWLAADADGRAAILAKLEPVEMDRAPHPALAVWDAMLANLSARSDTPRATLAADLSAGWFLLPTRAKGANAKADKMTPEAATDAALDAIFGAAEADATDAPTDTDTTDEAPAPKRSR
jgi:hypothetical protein